MRKYPIKVAKKDFTFLETNFNTKGSRKKKLVVDKNGNKAFFKYEGKGYNVSESCSEKMCYEIAKVLGYDCAKIELARDNEGNLGILNYLFLDKENIDHNDAVSYLNINEKQRKNYYTISNIKQTLDKLDKSLFKGFVKIMIFDALVGEQDRHEENWGIEGLENNYKISPLYDNGCNLLKEFKDENLANQYYNNQKDFNAYINRSKTIIYKEDNKSKYKHFELIKYLYENYSDLVKNEIDNLNKLSNKNIEEIVNKVPDDLLTRKHKEFIIIYLKRRRDILLEIKEGEK